MENRENFGFFCAAFTFLGEASMVIFDSDKLHESDTAVIARHIPP